MIEAYNVYNNSFPQLSGWHRDLIYYNITPIAPNGPFLYNFQEHIKSFRMVGDPVNAYKKISDQSEDPRIIKFIGDLNSSHWTRGFFEFKIRTLINAKNGVGDEIVKYFSARPDEIFDIRYRKVSIRVGLFRRINVYVFDGISLKEKSLNLPIFNWDLDEYASTIKIEIEEVDLLETTVLTDTRSVKFATNFGFDAGFGEKVKRGLKFGASAETIITQTVQKTFTQGNDLLGATIINFADNVIISRSNGISGIRYTTREYDLGWCAISVEPSRVQ